MYVKNLIQNESSDRALQYTGRAELCFIVCTLIAMTPVLTCMCLCLCLCLYVYVCVHSSMGGWDVCAHNSVGGCDDFLEKNMQHHVGV